MLRRPARLQLYPVADAFVRTAHPSPRPRGSDVMTVRARRWSRAAAGRTQYSNRPGRTRSYHTRASRSAALFARGRTAAIRAGDPPGGPALNRRCGVDSGPRISSISSTPRSNRTRCCSKSGLSDRRSVARACTRLRAQVRARDQLRTLRRSYRTKAEPVHACVDFRWLAQRLLYFCAAACTRVRRRAWRCRCELAVDSRRDR